MSNPVGRYKRHLLYLADGDLHKALEIAIEQLAAKGALISAGFVRDPRTYSHIPSEVSESIQSLDIDDTVSPHG